MGEKDNQSREERRQYKRIHKNFILTYYDKDNPDHKYEITQLKNISMGGLCFVTSQGYNADTNLAIVLDSHPVDSGV